MAPTSENEKEGAKQAALLADELTVDVTDTLGEKLMEFAATNRELGTRISEVLAEYRQLCARTEPS